jgi:prepilin-type N-terminal cleavage/methylation domain-containing protein
MTQNPTGCSRRQPRRDGFTLLEMILALAIGLVLMAALYALMSSQLMQAQSGREVTEEALTARAILSRIGNDIIGSLGAYDPRQLPEVAVDLEAADSEMVDLTEMTDMTEMAPDAAISAPQFNLGVVGESDRLILTTGRVPREVMLTGARVSDLRRITYWLVAGKGLAREEVKLVTGDEIDLVPPDVDNPVIIAPQVVALSFQYWDPQSQWLASWDGSQPADLPYGPPAAIEISITMGGRIAEDGTEIKGRVYTHVVSLPTGNNFSVQETPMMP